MLKPGQLLFAIQYLQFTTRNRVKMYSYIVKYD